MEVFWEFRQSLYHIGASAVGALQEGAPPGLDDILLKVSSWGDPSQVCTCWIVFQSSLFSGFCPLLSDHHCIQLPQRPCLPWHFHCQWMDKYGNYHHNHDYNLAKIKEHTQNIWSGGQVVVTWGAALLVNFLQHWFRLDLFPACFQSKKHRRIFTLNRNTTKKINSLNKIL